MDMDVEKRLVLEAGREFVVDVILEMVLQEPFHHAAGVRGHQAAAVQFHVVAPDQRGDDAGIGGGPANAIVLHGLHQRGL